MQKRESKLILLFTFISSLLFYCYEFYLRLLPSAYADKIMHLYHTGPLNYSFLVSSFNITYLIMQIPAGLILDKYNNKIVLTGAILLCGLGNIIFSASEFGIALFGRMLIGLGAAFAFVGILKISREYISKQYFAFLTSIVISVGTLAAAYAEEVSTILVKHIQWHEIFIISSAFSPIIACFTWFTLASLNKKKLQRKKSAQDKRTLLTQTITLIRNKAIIRTAVIGGLLYVPTIILTAQWGVYFFSHTYHMTRENSTFIVTYILLGWVILSPLIGAAADHFGREKRLLVTFSSLSIILLFFIFYPNEYTKTHPNLLGFLYGCTAAAQVLIWRFFNVFCPNELTGVGIAITNMIITFITEAFQIIVGAFMQWHQGTHLFRNLTHENSPIQFAAIVIFSAVLLALFLLRKLTSNKG